MDSFSELDFVFRGPSALAHGMVDLGIEDKDITVVELAFGLVDATPLVKLEGYLAPSLLTKVLLHQ